MGSASEEMGSSLLPTRLRCAGEHDEQWKCRMPIEYEIIEDKRLVIAKGSGVVTGNDVISHLDTLAADEKYLSPMKKLVD